MFRNLFKKSIQNRTKLSLYGPFFTLSNDYKKYLSNHIIKIMEQKPHNFMQCQNKFQQILTSNRKQTQQQNIKTGTRCQWQQKISIKLNMIFRIYTLPIIFQKYKQQLSQIVIKNKIKNQSDLDRICNIITKNIKINKNFSLLNIQLFNEATSQNINKQRQQYQKQIQLLTNSKQIIDIQAISKKLRQKYMHIDSKQIYSTLKNIQDKTNIQTKVNVNKQILQQQNNIQNKQKSGKKFWDKLQNIKPRLLAQQCNDLQIYKKHEEITNKQLRFRFPPQPNGYLHIGHIKSIRINFQTAKRCGGLCFLRYDDTNPETQSHQYIENIQKNVRWLGYSPDYITYASDHFEQMIQYAIQFIRQGHAYVCDSSQIDIQRQRKQKLANPYRNRSIQQSLSMFPNLKQGQTLRLKLDPAAKNPTLRDPVIYRIKENCPHPRTGNKYRIYPIYDFAHCICDSLQHIDYSLCSLQFQVRRQLYYKILDLLKLYKPSVWQYSRLNVQGSVISKRKIKALIQSQAIQSWNDPRLLTIGGLINRGYTPSMLLNFIDKVNASRAGNQNIIQFSLLQRQMRKQLFKISQKSMIVLNPQIVQIDNIDEQQIKQIQIDVYTDPQKKQKRQIRLTKKLYIQADQNIGQVGKIIILKYAGIFKIIHKSQPTQLYPTSTIKLQKLTIDIKQLKQKNQQYKIIHWISPIDSIQQPVILYDKLLTPQNKINQASKIIYSNAQICKQLIGNKNNINKYWQMERLGYFKFDGHGVLFRCTALQ